MAHQFIRRILIGLCFIECAFFIHCLDPIIQRISSRISGEYCHTSTRFIIVFAPSQISNGSVAIVQFCHRMENFSRSSVKSHFPVHVSIFSQYDDDAMASSYPFYEFLEPSMDDMQPVQLPGGSIPLREFNLPRNRHLYIPDDIHSWLIFNLTCNASYSVLAMCYTAEAPVHLPNAGRYFFHLSGLGENLFQKTAFDFLLPGSNDF